jgi:hypothetical protein
MSPPNTVVRVDEGANEVQPIVPLPRLPEFAEPFVVIVRHVRILASLDAANSGSCL